MPADIVTQILNFGLPAPIDVQIEGSDLEGNRQVANRLLAELRRVPGLTDLRIQQNFDYPNFQVSVDRTKAAGAGFTPRDVANSMLLTLSGSGQTNPVQFLNWQNGVSYNLVTQAPQYSIESLQDLQNVPISGATTSRPQILGDVAAISRGHRHGGDLALQHAPGGGHLRVGAGPRPGRGRPRHHADRRRQPRQHLPRGSFVTLRGQVETMRASYVGLLGGLAFAIVLVYLLIVVNFQSWLDPFIIITALPAALAGIIVFLFLTDTTLSVPALDGRDHVHGGGHREQHPGGVLRQGAARRAR